MDFWEWWATRDWVSTGGMLTAVFTGFTAWMLWRNRERSRIEVDPISYRVDGRERTVAALTFAVRNMGTRPAFGVRVLRVRPSKGAKPIAERIASIPAGESVEFVLRYAIPFDGPFVLNEETGEYPRIDPERVDFGDDEVEVITLRPPRLRKERSQRVRVDTLRQALQANGG